MSFDMTIIYERVELFSMDISVIIVGEKKIEYYNCDKSYLSEI